MKTQVFTVLAACCLLLLPVVGNSQYVQGTAAIKPVDEQRSCAHVLEMLNAGATPEAVVKATVATGMSLADATVYAMGCGGDSNRVAIAVAGVKLATTLAQAQSVADAVIAIAGETSDVATAVREAVVLVAKGLPQPSIYVDEYTPTGTDVSPAS